MLVLKVLKQPKKAIFMLLELLFGFIGNRKCYICKKKVLRFVPYRDGLKSTSPFNRELKVIGSDVENFSCPRCECHDRERHLFMYFDVLDLWKKFSEGRILHFAPEKHLRDKLQKLNTDYVMGDLFPTDRDITKIDITNIQFEDSTFHAIICNHVLEHIPDDTKALSELFRVLHKGGFAILQTPYSQILKKTFEDDGIISTNAREIAYGQEDHIRLYGSDFFDRISKSGFEVQLIQHAENLSLDPKKYGVNAEESLILCWKK